MVTVTNDSTQPSSNMPVPHYYLKPISPIQDCRSTPSNTLTNYYSHVMTNDEFKKLTAESSCMSSKDNSKLWYSRTISKLCPDSLLITCILSEEIDVFATFGPPWPWPWICSYGIPSCSTHRPLSAYQISLKFKVVGGWMALLLWKLVLNKTVCQLVCSTANILTN